MNNRRLAVEYLIKHGPSTEYAIRNGIGLEREEITPIMRFLRYGGYIEACGTTKDCRAYRTKIWKAKRAYYDKRIDHE